MESSCENCRATIVGSGQSENGSFYESGMFIVLGTADDFRASAAAGCQICAIFSSYTSLYNGIGPYHRQAQQLFDLRRELLLEEKQKIAAAGGHDPIPPKPKEKKGGPILCALILVAEGMLALSSCFAPETPMTFVLRDQGEIQHLLPEQDCVLEDHTGSASTFRQVQKWMTDCSQNHKACRVVASRFHPKRLLQLSKESDTARLREVGTGGVQSDVPLYATLSHCWGGTVPHRLLKENMAQLVENGIQIATLGQSFQDAIKIALEIGVRFIWIDSLCIIQDCPQDWLEQSVQMQHIYGQSFCNIAATASADGGGGCFRTRRTEALRPVKLRWEEEYEGQPSVFERYLTDAGLWWYRFEREPLNRRAWVLQERMLAPRVLHYDHDQVVWECNELTATERFPRGLGRLIGASNATSILRAPLEPNLRVNQERAVAGRALAEIWRPVVRLYTTLAITRWTDRLIALAGVGQRIQDRLGWDYVAGLFHTDNMASQLCWRRMDDGDQSLMVDPANMWKLVTRPQLDFAVPSWSWMGIDGPINFLPHWERVQWEKEQADDDQAPTSEAAWTGDRFLAPDQLDEKLFCKVVAVHKGASDAEMAGAISTAKLELLGCLIQITFAAEVKANMRKGLSDARTRAESHHTPTCRAKCIPILEASPVDNTTDTGAKNRASLEFSTKFAWDIWDEVDPDAEIYLMPVHELTTFKAVDIWEKSDFRTIRGLVLERASAGLTGQNGQFKRLGHFELANGKDNMAKFIEVTEKCNPIEGVKSSKDTSEIHWDAARMYRFELV